MNLGTATPIFRVEDLRASVDYYTRVLGFKVDWEGNGVACVTRDRCEIFLCEGDQTNGTTWVWLSAPDLEALHEELRSKGAHIRQPPTNFDWAFEMQVMDYDGNVLRIGSEPKKDVPYGPWLDSRGRFWTYNPDGSWSTPIS